MLGTIPPTRGMNDKHELLLFLNWPRCLGLSNQAKGGIFLLCTMSEAAGMG